MLSAANGSAAVEDNGDTCLVTIWAAFASDVSGGSASRLAHGDGHVQLRGQPLSFSGRARGPAFSRGLVHVVSGIERSGRTVCVPIVVARIGGRGSRTRKPVR